MEITQNLPLKGLCKSCGTCLFLFAVWGLHGQNTVKGSLTDQNDQALSYANVMLLSTIDSALAKGTVSEEDGTFQIQDIAPGSYWLVASMLGYEEARLPSFSLTGPRQELDVGSITLTKAVNELAAVEVKAKKPLYEKQVDRLVVNVQNSVTSAGNTALEVLSRSPGIFVNQQTNTLSIGGKSGVIVLINGKRNRMPIDALVQLLASTNASNIEKIEIITSPGSKYDADGNAGIINIVMKENLNEGLNGTASANIGYGRRGKIGGSLNFNYRKDKLNLYGDYSFLHDQTQQDWSSFWQTDIPNLLTTNSTFSDREAFTNTHNGRMGLDLEIGKNTSLGLLFGGNSRYWYMDAVNSIQVDTNQVLFYRQIMRNQEKNYWTQLMGNLNLVHRFSVDQTLEFNLDYLHYDNDNPSWYDLQTIDQEHQAIENELFRLSKLTPIQFWVTGIDYVMPLGGKIKWETGVKGTLSQFDNDIRLENWSGTDWVLDPDFSADYHLVENIAAAYTSFSFTVGEKITLITGLRYEHTVTNLGTAEEPDIVDRNYGNWFPTLSMTYALKESQSFQLTYNRRINRPTFNQLAPFVIFIDPFTFISGNAALQPSITNTARIGYQLKNYFVSLEYSYEEDAIANWQPSVDVERNVLVMMAQNLNHTQTLDLTFSIPVYIGNWWEMQNTLSGIWQQTDAGFTETPLCLTNRYARINSVQTFSLPKQFTLEVSGWWQTKAIDGIYDISPFGALNLGIQKSFGKHKKGGTLSLNISDVLNTVVWDWTSDFPELFLDTNSFLDLETRIVRLTYSLNFGNQNVKARRNRKVNSSDAQQRVNF